MIECNPTNGSHHFARNMLVDTNESRTIVPTFYGSNAPKVALDISNHFQVPKLLALLRMTGIRRRFRVLSREPRRPTSIGMPKNRKCFWHRFSLHY